MMGFFEYKTKDAIFNQKKTTQKKLLLNKHNAGGCSGINETI